MVTLFVWRYGDLESEVCDDLEDAFSRVRVIQADATGFPDHIEAPGLRVNCRSEQTWEFTEPDKTVCKCRVSRWGISTAGCPVHDHAGSKV